MKKFLTGLLVGMMLMIPVSVFAQSAITPISAYLSPNIKVSVDGESLDLENAVIVYNERTYLPVRELVENIMGKEVNWIQETETVEITSPDPSPVNDSSNKNYGAGNKGFGYTYDRIFFDPPEDVDVSYVQERIKEANIWIKQLNQMIELQDEASQRDVTVYPDEVINIYKEEIPKLQERIEYWEALLKELTE